MANKVRYGSSRTLEEDLALAYKAAKQGNLGRWRERILLWHGVDIVSAENIIAKRKPLDGGASAPLGATNTLTVKAGRNNEVATGGTLPLLVVASSAELAQNKKGERQMRCVADQHYEVVRNRHTNEIKRLKCAFCHFAVSKAYTPKPRSSTSGLGRYNRMRGKMVAHLHKCHRSELNMSDTKLCAK